MSDSPEYLNVDEIAPKVRKTIKLKGIEHVFSQPSIGTFLSDIQEMKALKEKHGDLDKINDEATMEIVVDQMIRTVRRAFPTVSEEDAKGLSFDQLTAIKKFIEARVEQDIENAEDEAGNG